MTLRTLTNTDLTDLLFGAALLGSGGGGPLWLGAQIIKTLPPNSVRLAEVSDVPDDVMMGVTSFAGVPAVLEKQSIDYGQVTSCAYQSLQKAKAQSFSHVLPLETGAGNSFIPLAVAAANNLIVVDADGARRAIPSPLACTWASLPMSPIAVAASETAQLTISGANNSVTMEALFPMLLGAPSFNKGVALAMWSMNGATMKQNAVAGSISYAIALGRTIREAQQQAGSPVQAAVDYLHGHLLFIGQLKMFSQGVTSLGSSVFSNGSTEVVVYNQPDNLLVWSNQHAQPLAMAPDLICFMTTTGQPLSTADLGMVKPDQDIAIIGAPALSQLRQPPLIFAYMAILNAIGYAGPFLPIEDIFASA